MTQIIQVTKMKQESINKMIETKKRLFREGKIKVWNKGRKETRQEVIEKLKKSHIGKPNSNKGKKFRPHTEEEKRKVSNKLKGRQTSDEHRRNLRIATLNYIKDFKLIRHRIGRNETAILDNLQETIGYRIARQLCIEGYFVDGYIPELNLVIEIDEPHHTRRIEKDKIREEIIKNKLGCTFLRIKDD